MNSVFCILVLMVSLIDIPDDASKQNPPTLEEQIRNLYEKSKDNPGNVERNLMLVKALKKAHRFEEGRDILIQLKQLYPENTLIKYELSQILLILDKTNPETLDLAKACVDTFPDNKEYMEYYGYLQQQFGFHKEAIRTIQKLLAMEPGNEMYRYQLASAFHFSGQDKKAIEILEPLVEDSPKPYSLALAGRVYQSLGDPEKAEIFLQKALQLDPINELAAEELGKLYLEQNHPQKALKYLQLAAEQNPFSLRVAMKLSEALLRNQQREEAKRIMERVKHLRSYSEQKRYQLHHLFENGAVKLEEHKRLAAEFFQLNLSSRAKPHLQAIVDEDPSDTDAAYALASLEFQHKNFENALQLLHLIEDSPHSQNDYFQAMLTICLGETGKIKEAHEILQQAKTQFPNSQNIKDAETFLNKK